MTHPPLSWRGMFGRLAVCARGGAVALAALAAGTPAAQGADAFAALRAGDKAPKFSLKPARGEELVSLDGLIGSTKHKGAVVLFLAGGCADVAKARSTITALSKRHGAKLRFLGIDPAAVAPAPATDVKVTPAPKVKFPFEVLPDPDATTAKAYATTHSPAAFLIDATGTIQYRGGIADLGTALKEFTTDKPLSLPEAEAKGCAIAGPTTP